MRKQLALFVTFAVLVAIPLSTSAGIKRSPHTGVQKGQFEFSPAVGVSLPTGDLADGGAPGFVVGGRFGYNISDAASIGATLNFNSFGIDNELQALFAPGVDVDLTSLEYMADFRILFNSRQRETGKPYIKGMLGAAKMKVGVSLGSSSASVSESKFAAGGGLGYLIKGQGNIGGFIEALIVTVATEGSSSTYISLRGGLAFFFGSY